MRAFRNGGLIAALFFVLMGPAVAQDIDDAVGTVPVEDVPIDGYVTLREAASPIAEEVHVFHNYVIMPVMVVISLFVLALLIWVAVRYNAKANPVAKKFSHNTTVEVVWTVVPVLILLYIALFSFDLLYLQDKMPDAQTYYYDEGVTVAEIPADFADSRMPRNEGHIEVSLMNAATDGERMLTADDYSIDGFGTEALVVTLNRPVPAGERLKVVAGRSRIGARPFLGLFGEDKSRIVPAPTITIKAIGFQWGWTYSYPDFGDFEFDSLIAPEGTVPSELYRLATTNDVVVPAGETVRIITTARDVIHSWAMPAFGVKVDAIPGRNNETWFYSEKLGTYYGQCSEICGIDHAFMPISVRVVSRSDFEEWVDEQAELNGLDPFFTTTDEQLADADVAATGN